MILILVASLAAIEAAVIVLLLRREPEPVEPLNSHPGRVLPTGVPIGHALKSAPEPAEEEWAPKFYVPYGDPGAVEEQRELLRKLLGLPSAEQALLGALIIDQNQIPRVLKILPEPGMFSAARHVLIYQAILWLHRERFPVDLVTLRSELASQGVLELIGGPMYLMQLVESAPNAANAPEYARSVFDLFFARLK